MQQFHTKKLVLTALLIAVEIVLSRFCSIATPIAKIGFAFLPLVMVAMLFGPLYAGMAGAAADFIGAILFPIGAYFPGFTLTAFLVGLAYGYFLYRKPKGIARISIMVLAVSLFLHLGLNTVWLWIITGKGFWAILPTRILQTAVMVPVMVLGSFAVGNSPQLKRVLEAHAGNYGY